MKFKLKKLVLRESIILWIGVSKTETLPGKYEPRRCSAGHVYECVHFHVRVCMCVWLREEGSMGNRYCPLCGWSWAVIIFISLLLFSTDLFYPYLPPPTNQDFSCSLFVVLRGDLSLPFWGFWVFPRPVTMGGCGLPFIFSTWHDSSRRHPRDSPGFQIPSSMPLLCCSNPTSP